MHKYLKHLSKKCRDNRGKPSALEFKNFWTRRMAVNIFRKAGFTIWERLSVASRASSHVVLRGSGTYRVTRVVPFTIRFQHAVDVAA